MAKKAHPERVIPVLAEKAIKLAKDANCAYSEYVRLYYQSTGKLASGCDSRDLIAWLKANMPEEYEKKCKQKK
jgi:hypothetical protein